MSDGVEASIVDALLDDLPHILSPDIPISFPNIVFKPPPVTNPPDSPTVWLRATLLPADSVDIGQDYGSSVLHSGILQIDCFQQEGRGEVGLSSLADTVKAFYARGTFFTKNGFKVEVTRTPTRLRLQRDAPWAFIPVHIRWVCISST